MEFPRHLHKPGGYYVVCESEEHLSELSVRGWALLPECHVEQPKEVRFAEAIAEPAGESAPVIDDDTPAPPKRRGRPRADAVN